MCVVQEAAYLLINSESFIQHHRNEFQFIGSPLQDRGRVEQLEVGFIVGQDKGILQADGGYGGEIASGKLFEGEEVIVG